MINGVKMFSRYVLKPQREGGGNNVYGHDIPSALRVGFSFFWFFHSFTDIPISMKTFTNCS